MSNNFRRGQKVVCIVEQDVWTWGPLDGPYSGEQLPIKGGVYTIEDIAYAAPYGPPPQVWVALKELPWPRWFLGQNFRPATDISLFHEILRKVNAPKQKEELNV